jgi:two-component system cell cycle sensor histidine kinase/response regulator CckA
MKLVNQRLLPARRTWTAVALILSAGILVAGWFYFRNELRQRRAEAEKELSVIADLKVQQIAQWRRERIGDATYLRNTPYVARRAVDVLREPASAASTRQMLEASLKPFVRKGSFDHLLLLDETLTVRWAYPADTSGVLAETTRQAAARALASREIVVSDLHRETDDGPVYLSLMVPFVVRREGGKENVPAAGKAASPEDHSAGVLVMQINTRDYLDPLLQAWPMPSRTAETLLARREGDDIVVLNELRHRRDAALKLRLSLTNSSLPMAQGFSGKQGVVAGRDYRQVPVVAAVKAIPDAPWMLAAKMDEDEVQADAWQEARFLGLALGSLLLLVAAATAYGYRRQQAGLFRRLYESERREREAQALYRAALYSIGDAVITTDTAGRVREMNPAAEKLTGWPESEARNKPLEEVFRIVNAETRAAAENPAHRALRENRVVGLSNQTLLRGRDGVERPIADSAAPIHDEQGTVTGVVLVFSDQTERYAAREALRESEAFIRTVMDNLPIGIAVNSTDPEVKFVYMNDNFPRIYRTTREALADPDAFWEAVYEDAEFREQIRRRVLADCASGNPDRMVWRDIPLTRRGDRTTYISARNTPVPDRRLMISTVWDVTDRRLAEERLRLQSSALEAVAYAVLITDREGTIEWANAAFTALTGYSAAEAVGRKPGELLKSGKHDAAFYRTMWDTILAGNVWRGEIVNRRKEGGVYTEEMTITPLRDERGGITHFIAIKSDVTERKRTESRLRAFAALGQQLGAAKTIREAAQIVVDAADQLLGWEACTFDLCSPADQKLQHVLNMDTVDGRRVECPSTYANDAPSPLARRVITEGGLLILKESPTQMAPGGAAFGDTNRPSASILLAPIRRGREAIGLISIHSYTPQAYDEKDLETLQSLADHCGGALDRIRAEERMRTAQEQLRQSQKMQSIGQLAGGVAHDFNNLLTVIQGHASLMRMGLSPEDQQHSLQEISLAADRAANLTRQLLAFSRRQVMQAAPVSLNDIVSGMIKMLHRIIGEDITLQTRLLNGGAPVYADPGMIEQVLLNLAVNARDAMPKGGQISISITAVSFDAAAAALRPHGRPGQFIRLSFSDTGCGIPSEHLPRIFEPFFTTKDIGKGTGLGLATVDGIVAQHQGWIEVQSTVGQGTTFHVYLPRWTESAPAQTATRAAAPVRGGHETILLVEDESPLRGFVIRVLERYGYRVLAASDGVAALELWRQHRDAVDLLLTDIIMPEGLSGPELAGQLAAAKPGLKVIYMSGYSGDKAGRNLKLREGFNFLEKPFGAVKLAQTVRQRLDAPPADGAEKTF